jgi:integrase/recombinase XerC
VTPLEVAKLKGGVISEFVRSMRRRGLAAGTIRRRWDVLCSFSAWLEPRPLLDATRADVEAYVDGRRCHSGGPIGSRTRYGYISHLHCFYEWAMAEELTEHDPTGVIPRPKLRQLLPRPISEADLAVALGHAPGLMRAWLVLAAYGGLRCAEIAGLDVGDVDLSSGCLRVLGKGEKERVVPTHPLVEVELGPWVRGRRSGPVFTRPHGGRFPPAMVSREGSLFLAGCGLSATMHQLRHRFATRALEVSGDLRAVQELLGHASPTTTAIYTKVSSRRLRAVVERIDAVGEWQPHLPLVVAAVEGLNV